MPFVDRGYADGYPVLHQTRDGLIWMSEEDCADWGISVWECGIDEFQCWFCGFKTKVEGVLYKHIKTCSQKAVCMDADPDFFPINAPFYRMRTTAQMLYQVDKKLEKLEKRVARHGEDPGVDNRGCEGGLGRLHNSPLIRNRVGDIQ
jgi:hypothetical protein